jgi:2-polyprenyl-3-methyl-5-hydroxy-6-metoxy-1,4-benzoquinol methylase
MISSKGLNLTTCRICSSAVRPHLKRNGYEVLKCANCGFGQVNVNADEIAKFYDKAYFEGERATFSQQENCEARPEHRYWIEKNLSRLPEGRVLRILEIGPGPGAPIGAYLQSVHPEMEFAAIEISEYACECLSARGFNVFKGGVSEGKIIDACRGKFDLIFGVEVIEHDPEPRAFVRAVHDMLKPGGWAAFTTGNINGLMARWNKDQWYYLDPPAHLSYFTPKAVKQVFGAEGFENISVKRYGFNYIALKLRTHLPGILALTHLSNVSTGMSIAAQRHSP